MVKPHLTMTTDSIPFELETLRNAKEYQKWVLRTIEPYLGKRIVELGSGIGNMSRFLPLHDFLALTEADSKLMKFLEQAVHETFGARPVQDGRVVIKEINLNNDWANDLAPYQADTIVSFNVLEHVEDHLGTLDRLVKLLRESKTPGPKRIITFVPAHAWLFGSLDKVCGHFRRYEAKDFKEICKKIGFKGKLETRYFNCLGMPGWFWVNKVTKKEVLDDSMVKYFEMLCPVVSPIDDFFHSKLRLPLGQSLIAIMTLEN